MPHTHVEDVTDILDGIEDQAEKILADLLVVLDRIATTEAALEGRPTRTRS